MGYLIAAHWGFLLSAGLLGLGMGWIAVVYRGTPDSSVQARWIGALVVVLLALSFGRIVPGRFGYWLDLGLALFAVYLVGCAVGSWLRDRVVSRYAASQ